MLVLVVQCAALVAMLLQVFLRSPPVQLGLVRRPRYAVFVLFVVLNVIREHTGDFAWDLAAVAAVPVAAAVAVKACFVCARARVRA